MGGRGTYAAGNMVPFSYKTIDTIEGIKVLEGIGGKHGLPAEAHTSFAYIQRLGNGHIKTIRFYDKQHRPYFEVAYHPEKKLDPSGKNVLHYHVIDGDIARRSDALRITKAMRKRYGQLFWGA